MSSTSSSIVTSTEDSTAVVSFGSSTVDGLIFLALNPGTCEQGEATLLTPAEARDVGLALIAQAAILDERIRDRRFGR